MVELTQADRDAANGHDNPPEALYGFRAIISICALMIFMLLAMVIGGSK